MGTNEQASCGEQNNELPYCRCLSFPLGENLVVRRPLKARHLWANVTRRQRDVVAVIQNMRATFQEGSRHLCSSTVRYQWSGRSSDEIGMWIDAGPYGIMAAMSYKKAGACPSCRGLIYYSLDQLSLFLFNFCRGGSIVNHALLYLRPCAWARRLVVGGQDHQRPPRQ